MYDIIRSKGFFDAIDDIDVDANISNNNVTFVKTNCNSNKNVSISAENTINKHVTQFRWQSVNNHFDYGPVLPPYVTLQIATSHK